MSLDHHRQQSWTCSGWRTQTSGPSVPVRDFSGDLPCSYWIFLNSEWIHNLSFSVETKAKSLLQSNISFDFNFEVKIFSKYLSWINLAAFISKYLLAAVAPYSAVKQFKESIITYSIQTILTSISFIFTFTFWDRFFVYIWLSWNSLCRPGCL